MNHSPRDNLEALRWIGESLLEQFRADRDFQPIRNYFAPPTASIEREMLLRLFFWAAMEKADWELGELCLQEGYPLSSPADEWPGSYAIASALRLGNRLNVVTWLIEHGAEVNGRKLDDYSAESPLIVASRRGLVEIVSLLLDHGADVGAVTVDGWNAIGDAAENGHDEVVAILLEHLWKHRLKFGKLREAIGQATARGHEEVARLIQTFVDRGRAN